MADEKIYVGTSGNVAASAKKIYLGQNNVAKLIYSEPSGTKSITANGTHDVKDYASASVNVQPNLGTKSITSNGTYNASSDNKDGYSSVTVNVPGITPSGTRIITSNGTYDVTNYASASVNVSVSDIKSFSDICSGLYGIWYAYRSDSYKPKMGIKVSSFSDNIYSKQTANPSSSSDYYVTWNSAVTEVTATQSGYYLYFRTGSTSKTARCTLQYLSSGQKLTDTQSESSPATRACFHLPGLDTSVFGPDTKVKGIISGVYDYGGTNGVHIIYTPYSSSGTAINGCSISGSTAQVVSSSTSTPTDFGAFIGSSTGFCAKYSGKYLIFIGSTSGSILVANYRYCKANEFLAGYPLTMFMIFYLG